MIKRVKTVFVCEVCSRSFRNPGECISHEAFCKKKKQDSDHFANLLLALLHHYEKQGYKVTLRYLDGELIWELRKK